MYVRNYRDSVSLRGSAEKRMPLHDTEVCEEPETPVALVEETVETDESNTAAIGESPTEEQVSRRVRRMRVRRAPLFTASPPEPFEVSSTEPLLTEAPSCSCREARGLGHLFDAEGLLLGGLLLLLLNDHADDDILLILGFLLLAGN